MPEVVVRDASFSARLGVAFDTVRKELIRTVLRNCNVYAHAYGTSDSRADAFA